MAPVDGSGRGSRGWGDRMARLTESSEQPRQQAGLGVDIPGPSTGAEEEDQEKDRFHQ